MRHPGSTRVAFPMHKLRHEERYKCVACGRRYKRAVSRMWTENPFHDWRGNEDKINRALISEMQKELKSVVRAEERTTEGQKMSDANKERDARVETARHEAKAILEMLRRAPTDANRIGIIAGLMLSQYEAGYEQGHNDLTAMRGPAPFTREAHEADQAVDLDMPLTLRGLVKLLALAHKEMRLDVNNQYPEHPGRWCDQVRLVSVVDLLSRKLKQLDENGPDVL